MSAFALVWITSLPLSFRILADIDEFLATVFQHEIDHLIGRLYVDRMKDITTLTYEDEMVLESAEN